MKLAKDDIARLFILHLPDYRCEVSRHGVAELALQFTHRALGDVFTLCVPARELDGAPAVRALSRALAEEFEGAVGARLCFGTLRRRA
ncbi:hypothetical protein [Metapseudomonas otitidis]|uniref:hypothetical protein n=1 Tax=Metapseudomonas otitidis TaxID=319939 RepID=UPI000D19942D|nr:hypothetical protein [Pseudomonas otitidis]